MTEPEYPDKEFLEGIYRQFRGELDAAMRNVARHRSPGMGNGVAYASTALSKWLTRSIPEQPQHWEDNWRMVSALLSSVKDGTFPLGDHDEVILLMVVSQWNTAFPSLLRRCYMDSGEFFAMFVSVAQSIFEAYTRVDELLMDFRVKALRLYCFDIENQQAPARSDDTGDDEGSLQLPFEVRMSLSGFYDELTDAERLWCSQVLPSPAAGGDIDEEMIESFRALNAQRSAGTL